MTGLARRFAEWKRPTDRPGRSRALGWMLALGLSALASSISSTGAAHAQADFDVDPDTPVEITADRFEVRPNEEVGTFTGNVRVIQGRITLAADTMDIFYAPRGAENQQSIRALHAKGSVRIATPNEQATGAWARYDMAGRQMELGGGVLLTRGPNVLEGARLSIDLVSSRTELLPYGEDGSDPAAAGPSKGRVRAVFTPPTGNQDDPDKP